MGCERYLNELYGVYDSVENVPWDDLPEQFAMKWNFGSGYNIICKDVKQLNLQKVKEIMTQWGKEKYWIPHAEMQYKNVKKQILIEKYLGNEDGAIPSDYKLYCFNGKCKAILYMENRDQKGAEKNLFFSPDWNFLGQVETAEADCSQIPCAPKSLREMIVCAESLSKNIPFVRVDLYEYNNQAYFGEMTFSPASGFFVFSTQIDGCDMGDYINLSETELTRFKLLEARI